MEWNKAADMVLGDFVYCSQHLRAHGTGWCTVPNDQKIGLKSDNHTDATIEVIDMGLPIYQHCEVCYAYLYKYDRHCEECKLSNRDVL